MEQLSTEQAAAQLNITPRYLRMLAQRRPELAPARVGRAWVWTPEKIEAVRQFIGEHGRKKADDITQ